MPTLDSIRPRNTHPLDVAVYLTVALLAAVGVILFSDMFVRALSVGLCVVFGLVYRFGDPADSSIRQAIAYFTAQTLILTGLIVIARTSDIFGLLFFTLGIQAVLVFPKGISIPWIILFYLIDSAGALWFRGFEGIINVLFNAAVFVLTFVFANALRQTELARRQNERLVEELRLAQRQVQDLAVAGERRRLALDLHDSVKQQVFATIMQIGAARVLVERDTQAASAHLVEAEQLAQQAGREVTMLIHELRPVPLDGKHLAEAIRDYATDWARHSGIAVEIHAGELAVLPAAHEHALLRVTQEALANAARHSQARAVTLELHDDSASVALTIADDGRGFDPVAVVRGVGLASMRERVEAIGGTLRVASQIGAGTSMAVVVPRHHKEMSD
jgi:signal transduction histidine kinase